jgi:hypothetical protein
MVFMTSPDVGVAILFEGMDEPVLHAGMTRRVHYVLGLFGSGQRRRGANRRLAYTERGRSTFPTGGGGQLDENAVQTERG